MSIWGNPVMMGGSGGESIIISKTIITNGTYNAYYDNADGYNPVTVNVSIGEEWDLTSETPLIGTHYGLQASQAGITFGANGAEFNAAADRMIFPCPVFGNVPIEIEVEVAQMQLPSVSSHQRFIMANASGKGFIYRSTGEWGMYASGWTMSGITDRSALDDCTVKVLIGTDGKWNIYKNGVLWWATNVSLFPTGDIRIGETDGQSIQSATIASVKTKLADN